MPVSSISSAVRMRVDPCQDPRGPERVPAAWLTGAAFHLEVDRTRVRIFERPAPLRIALARDEIDRLAHAIVRIDTGASHVVQPPEDVVVPAGGKRNLRPRVVDHPAGRP